MVKKYLSYKDDNEEGTIVKGFFEILEETENWIKVKTNSGKILKIQQPIETNNVKEDKNVLPFILKVFAIGIFTIPIITTLPWRKNK